MGKWRAKVRSFVRPTPPRSSVRPFDRCTRCRRTSPPQASDAFSSSARGEGREGANNTTPVLVASDVAPVLTLGRRLGKRRKVSRVVSFFLPLSQDPYPATDLAVDLTVSYCSSRPSLPLSLPLSAPLVSSSYSAFAVDGGPREEKGEGREGEREESPKTQTKLLPTD